MKRLLGTNAAAGRPWPDSPVALRQRAAEASLTPKLAKLPRAFRQMLKRTQHRNHVRTYRKRTPAPTARELHRDARVIGTMLARGFAEATIRRSLGLSPAQWKVQMDYLEAHARDFQTVWAKCVATTGADLRMLDEIRREALDRARPNFQVAIRATKVMAAVRTRLIETGQSLGRYPRVAPTRRSSAPSR